jgi:hypothetical protein
MPVPLFHLYFALKLSIVITFDEINPILDWTTGATGAAAA